MNKKELLENFWKGLAIIIIIGIVVCSIASLSYKKSFEISFIKDIYGILFTVFAAYTAIYLYSDWREEKKFEIKQKYAEKAWLLIDIYFKKQLSVLISIKENYDLNMILINTNFHGEYIKYKEQFKENNFEEPLVYFDLIEDRDLFKRYHQFMKNSKVHFEFIDNLIKENKIISEVNSEIIDIFEKDSTTLYDIRTDLKKYIIPK